MKNNSFIPAIRNGPNNNENGPDHELDHLLPRHRKITRIGLAELALQKYLKNGSGIDFTDVQGYFGYNKSKSQRILKRSCTTWLDKDGNKRDPILIRLSTRTKPQKFYPTSIKADIIEDFKKRENELIGATGVNLSISADPISNAVGYQKAQNFLDVLTQLPFFPLHIHRLLLKLSIDKEYYQTLTQKAALINRAKRFEEPIGRRYVTYTFSPNGRVEIGVRTSDTPFKLETEEDEVILFSFFGQVRDRLIYLVADPREREVPQITNWILKGCDLNKDVEIDEKAQLYLPDIQLKFAYQVFRMYVKSLHSRAVYRVEKSLTLSLPLVDAINSIILPMRAINDLQNEIRELSRKFD